MDDESNFAMEETNAPKLQTVMAIMIAVPFLFMALRFFSKAKYGRNFKWDDAVLLLSWVSDAGFMMRYNLAISLSSSLSDS